MIIRDELNMSHPENPKLFLLILLPFYRVRTWFLQRKKKKQKTRIQKIWFGALVALDASSEVPCAWRGDPRHFHLLGL